MPGECHDPGDAAHDDARRGPAGKRRSAVRAGADCLGQLRLPARPAMPGLERGGGAEVADAHVHGGRRMKSRVIAAAVAVMAFCAPTAAADRGVALDLGKVEIEQALTPGGGYLLPPVGVRNPGDERTTYRMVVRSVAGQSRAPVPESWVHFSPSEVTLRPGQTRKVQPRLSLPTGAHPGGHER